MSDTDELLRGLKLGGIAVASAALTAFAVIGVGHWVLEHKAPAQVAQPHPEALLIQTSG